MSADAPTMLLLTLGIGIVASAFLAFEWRMLQVPALAFWSAGFGVIALGCGLSFLREHTSLVLGLWTANGLLIVAHLLFVGGIHRVLGRRMTPLWWALLVPWIAVLGLPLGPLQTPVLSLVNAVLVAVASLASAWLLMSHRGGRSGAASSLGLVFLVHGAWYCVKAGIVFVPDAFVDLLSFKGFAIQLSLFEGILVEVLLALQMAGLLRQQREGEMVELAERDPLTGVFNRRAFERLATDRLRETAAHRRPLTLLLIDVDHFKTINDSVGHSTGDRVLTSLVDTLLPLLPHDGLAARLGGDEFVVLLPGSESRAALEIGNALCVRFAQLWHGSAGASVSSTVSIGAAVQEQGGGDLAALIELADGALYEAKRRGRNQLCCRSMPATRQAWPAQRAAAHASVSGRPYAPARRSCLR